MADICRVEFLVVAHGGDTQAYLDDKDDAIDEAKRIGGSVVKVTQYYDDRETIWPVDDDDDEDGQ